MPNGNTLICEALEGRIFEVTTDGTIVWTHFAGDSVHKAPRYWATATSAGPPAPTVRFETTTARPIRLEVVDAAGRRVAILAEGVVPAGVHDVVWDGRDAAGRPAASGAYLVRLAGEDGSSAIRIALVR